MTYFLYDSSVAQEKIAHITALLQKHYPDLRTLPYKQEPISVPHKSLLFLMIDDDSFGKWIQRNGGYDIKVVLIPYEKNRLQQENYFLPTLDASLELLQNQNGTYMQAYTLCNKSVALTEVIIGKNILQTKIWNFINTLFSTSLQPITIQTQKEQTITTAALSIEAANEAYATKKRIHFFKTTDNQCKRVACIIYAPGSIIEALRLRFFIVRSKEENKPLPKGIGVIKSNEITIQRSDGEKIDLFVNNAHQKVTKIDVKSVSTNTKILTGFSNCVKAEEKESLRIQHLPTEPESINFFTKKHLPLLPIASESDFADLFSKLRDSSKISRAYIILLIISVLMATTGLFQNSAPTIIGAMILAPLMAPIIAFSMGAIRFDTQLLQQSITTIVLSILVSLFLAALLAYLLPFSHVTQQMDMRTHPTILDLAVAIFAGIAAAYGYANTKVGESLAGVAIAVALVPPLCVSGIGLGWLDFSLFFNAFLLFLANIAGIIIASGAMFYFMGFASRKYASTAFLLKMLMLSIVIFPLWISTRTFFQEEKIYRTLSHLSFKNVSIKIEHIHIKENKIFVTLDIISKNVLSKNEKNGIIKKLKAAFGKNVALIIDYKHLL